MEEINGWEAASENTQDLCLFISRTPGDICLNLEERFSTCYQKRLLAKVCLELEVILLNSFVKPIEQDHVAIVVLALGSLRLPPVYLHCRQWRHPRHSICNLLIWTNIWSQSPCTMEPYFEDKDKTSGYYIP